MCAWEYLSNMSFDVRYEMAAAYLNSKPTFIGNVVDLNCGKDASFYYRILESGCSYYGNDINLEEEEIVRNLTIEKILRKIPDTEVINDLPNYFPRIDCLVLMGDGAGHLTGENQESATSLQTFFELIKKYKPQTVIYECVKRFEELYGLFSQVGDFVMEQGYEVGGKLELNIKPDIGFVSERIFGFYEKIK